MYEHKADPPQQNFMEAAQKEMIAFELKERQFRKKLKSERAEELHLPINLASVE